MLLRFLHLRGKDKGDNLKKKIFFDFRHKFFIFAKKTDGKFF